MSHQVENMFSVKETPWHGLGVVIQAAPTIEEGIKLAGLDWSVIARPVYREDGTSLADFAQEFVRADTMATLGIVGPNTYPLQNAKAFDFFEPYIDAKLATLETAGSLQEGRRIWVLAKLALPNAEIVKGDEVAKYAMLSNSHDGTLAVRIGFTPVRVVCANTLALAHSDKASKLIRLRHSKDVEKNLENIREVMDCANAQFEATAEQYRLLTTKQINQADLQKYVKLVFDVKEKPNGETSKQSQTLFGDITKLFESGYGTEISAVRGTLWCAYNAVSEYLNYSAGRGADTRLSSLWFGSNSTKNGRALSAALELANAV